MNDYWRQHQFPEELKEMDFEELDLLSYEIRDFLVDSVSRTGGHLASNLGVVELAIALHRSFDAPRDKIIWDVGHQSYVHKILTGRASQFETLRQFGGMSGFPKRCESEYDVFDTGHSSNSISLGLGMAQARDLQREHYSVVSVIGDGALTGGLAFEAMNNAGHMGTDLIVVLNDNGMSISPNTGGLSRHLVKLSSTAGYTQMKHRIKSGVAKVPVIGSNIVSGLQSTKDRIKYSMIEDGILFEELGFKYIGPVDGHNLKELCEVLELAKGLSGPVLVHALTTKGKGYSLAEQRPGTFHGIGPFDVSSGSPQKKSAGPSWSDIAGSTIAALAWHDPSICVISAAMVEGTGMTEFQKSFPGRTFDTGIAEGHAVSFAAGLARAGSRPYAVIYSTFLQRAYDQILEDVCLQNLPVVFCLDRAGIVGADGETHHGVFDISYMKSMPNLTMLAPASGEQLDQMLRWTSTHQGPCAIRYPRGTAFTDCHLPDFEGPGKAQRLRAGRDAVIWSCGAMLPQALEAADLLELRGISTGVVNMTSLKPLDEASLREDAAAYPCIATLEDGMLLGGIGESIGALLADTKTSVLRFGWPDQFIEHGEVKQLYEKYGLDAPAIAERITRELETET